MPTLPTSCHVRRHARGRSAGRTRLRRDGANVLSLGSSRTSTFASKIYRQFNAPTSAMVIRGGVPNETVIHCLGHLESTGVASGSGDHSQSAGCWRRLDLDGGRGDRSKTSKGRYCTFKRHGVWGWPRAPNGPLSSLE
ncbi:hypothetical protein GQ53DRAFT_70380 [Thozetella sp. PMI_491]|nr:hypothetical protein GQ53DRAFT_70380 [Thozetella sp. PMI_491]